MTFVLTVGLVDENRAELQASLEHGVSYLQQQYSTHVNFELNIVMTKDNDSYGAMQDGASTK